VATTDDPSRRPVGGDVLRVVLALGLLAGLGEGAGLLLAQSHGVAHWWLYLFTTHEVLWVAPICEFLIFLAFGLPAALVLRRAPPRVALALAAGGATVVLAYDWLRLTGDRHRLQALLVAAAAAVAVASAAAWRPRLARAFGKIGLPLLLGASALAWAGTSGRDAWRERSELAALPPAPAGARNVLLIVVDTLRADHCDFLGYGRATMPNVGRLAREGALFTDAYSAAPWTLPSHASLLTGRYTYEHGATIVPLDDRYPTIAESMSRLGWRTLAVSANTSFFNRRQGMGRGFARFDDGYYSAASAFQKTLFGRELEAISHARLRKPQDYARRSAENVNRSLLEWLDSTPPAPFFAFLNYFDVHDPYVAPEPWRSRFAPQHGPGGRISGPHGFDYSHLPPEVIAEEMAAYDGGIAYVDSKIGELLDGLKQRGLLEKTLVIVTADHGESFGEHGIFLHRGNLFREQIHVPLVLWAPGLVPAGRRVDVPVSNVSLPATLVELLGLDADGLFPVPSLAPLLDSDDPGAEWPDPVVEIYRHPWEPYRGRPVFTGWMRSIVHGTWQLIRHEKDGDALYDRAADPGQRSDQIAAQPKPAQLLRELLDAFLARLAAHPHVEAEAPSMESLEGVGYVGNGKHAHRDK
jgi:arylsulfatase A-like enzyme